MKATPRRNLLLFVAVTLSLLALSCSTGPEQAKVGTPVFHWNAARTTYGSADYNKVNDNLAEVIKTDNEFTARALPWRLVVLDGMTKGYSELAEIWESGGNANRAHPTPFRTQMNLYRKTGGQLALQYAETLQKFEAAGKGQKVTLAFAFPTGSAAEIPQLKRAASGLQMPEVEIATLEKRVLDRAVLLAACRAAGAPEDSAKAQQIFKTDPVEVEWPVFAAAVANGLCEQAQFFTRDHLDRPDRVEFFGKKALEFLKAVPESKETKSQRAKIEKTMKKR
jgi:hypothetical protein